MRKMPDEKNVVFFLQRLQFLTTFGAFSACAASFSFLNYHVPSCIEYLNQEGTKRGSMSKESSHKFLLLLYLCLSCILQKQNRAKVTPQHGLENCIMLMLTKSNNPNHKSKFPLAITADTKQTVQDCGIVSYRIFKQAKGTNSLAFLQRFGLHGKYTIKTKEKSTL